MNAADGGAAARRFRAVAGLTVEPIEALVSRVSSPGDYRLPPRACVLQTDRQVGGRELVACLLRPLDKAYIIPPEGIAKACINPLIWIFESIEIKMMQV